MNNPTTSRFPEAAIDTPPEPNRIYVNRNLRMDSIRAIGFDMDYTLALYKRQPMEELAYRLTIDKLIARGYPAEIQTLEYDADFVIRGLTIDKQFGNILKLDRHNHVARSFHGHHPQPKKMRRDMYRRERVDFTPPRFAVVDTLFSLPEMCLYADMVDFFDERGQKIDTWRLYEDIRESIDEAHRDNSLKAIVKADLAKFIERDPLLPETLHKLRSAGKKLFLLTNSLWDYTDALMHFLLDGALPEYPSWKKYFELIIVGAKKPTFFTDREPFAELNTAGDVVHRPVRRLQRGKIYMGGNLQQFEQNSGFIGEEVLYVGDHIYGDILRSKKSSLWRTAMIVEELESEITNVNEHIEDFTRLRYLESERRRMDDLANAQRRRLSNSEKARNGSPPNGAIAHLKAERDQTKKTLKAIIREQESLRAKLDMVFNPNWGMVFKEDNENSRFGEQVATYACLYSSRVSNFLYYSAYQYFRSPRDLMPHER